MKQKVIKAVDFFCSGGGMTKGMVSAGIKVIAGIDNDIDCKETYEANNSGVKFILEDVFKLKESELENNLSLRKNDNNLLFIGCSPCQYWSIIRTNKSSSEKSKNLLGEFQRFVVYFNPGYVVVENVPGIIKRKDESGLSTFIETLENLNYKVKYEIVNMNEYGIPQSRKRFTLIASRVGNNYIFLKKDNIKPIVKNFLGESNGFPKISAGHKDPTSFFHTSAGLSEKNLLRLKGTNKDGGDSIWWRDDKDLGRDKYKGNGFKDNYSRISWDKPSPTITTKFFSISNGRFAHPDENRAISIREGATLQTFPKDYIFYTKSINIAAKMIGNAVPPLFAQRIGEAILNSF